MPPAPCQANPASGLAAQWHVLGDLYLASAPSQLRQPPPPPSSELVIATCTVDRSQDKTFPFLAVK